MGPKARSSFTSIRKGAPVLLLVAGVIAAQLLVEGPSLLKNLPILFLGIVTFFWVFYAIRDRQVRWRSPADSRFTVSASLYVSGIESSQTLRHVIANARLGMVKTLGQGAATGYLDFLGEALRWRPGPVSRRWGFQQFVVSRDQIVSKHLDAAYPAAGRLASILEIDLKDGSKLEFWTRDARGVQDELQKLVV